tara:strand:+ start:385 stop:1110 length:726 start_codon:yes stop_codon:yes gene_type:complete
MNKKLKLFLGISYLVILSMFLYFVFLQIEISRLNDFSYYKEFQINIDSFLGDKLYINLLIYFVFSIIWVILLGFGSPLLIVSGIFFGKWIGTFVSVISISIGALILYQIANFFFKDLIKDLLEKKFSKYINFFKQNEFYYFFVFRLVGGLGVPFALQNILPAIFNMKKFNYFFSSLLGFIPSFFVWNTIGSGISKFIKESDSFSFTSLIFSKEIYFPVIMFIILVLISLVIKNKIFNVKYK